MILTNKVVWYRDQVGEQKKKKVKLVEVEEVEEWKVEKILNKKNKRGDKVSDTIEGVYSRAW